jgi:hypothetical protein
MRHQVRHIRFRLGDVRVRVFLGLFSMASSVYCNKVPESEGGLDFDSCESLTQLQSERGYVT